jgi:hypothetical protein
MSSASFTVLVGLSIFRYTASAILILAADRQEFITAKAAKHAKNKKKYDNFAFSAPFAVNFFVNENC